MRRTGADGFVRAFVFAASLASAVTAFPCSIAAAQAPADAGPWIAISISAQPLISGKQAPADEYFGVQRLSVLGIRSMVHAMNVEGTSPLALPLQLERIAGIRSALGELIERYPDDRWLPGELLAFAKFLIDKRQPFTDDLAEGYLAYVRVRFPSSSAGTTAAALIGSTDFHAFDMSEAPMPDPHENVADYVFLKIRQRR